MPGVLAWLLTLVAAHAGQSIARVWDEQALKGIRTDTPNPPVQARNLFSYSVCMYDAWAAYDTNGAVGFISRAKYTAPDIAAARAEAISYAAWRMMKERHFYSKTAGAILGSDDALFASAGKHPVDPIPAANDGAVGEVAHPAARVLRPTQLAALCQNLPHPLRRNPGAHRSNPRAECPPGDIAKRAPLGGS